MQTHHATSRPERLGANPPAHGVCGKAMATPPRFPVASASPGCVLYPSPWIERVRMPESQHPVASVAPLPGCTFGCALGSGRRTASARHWLTVPSFARARVQRPECLEVPEAIRLRVRCTAPHRANGMSSRCGGVDGVGPHSLRVRPRPAARRRTRSRCFAGGRGSWFGPGVGVVAEKNGQATVATETSRGSHARDAGPGCRFEQRPRPLVSPRRYR